MNEHVKTLVALGIDQINKVPVADFSAQDRNEIMRKEFLELMGVEKFDAMAYNKHKYEIFEVIRETLQATLSKETELQDSFVSRFVDERNVEYGDAITFEVDNDAYLTVGKISGNNWDLDRQRIDRGASVTPKINSYYIKIYDYFKKFMSGRMDFAEISEKVYKSIAKFKSDFVAEVFQSAVSGLPSEFSYSGAYDKAKIQGVLDHVTASNGGNVVLVGTKGALNKLQNITDVVASDKMADELNNNGFLRRWAGYDCAELPTAFKANSKKNFIFDNDKIFVLNGEAKPVKIVNEGQMLVAETNDITNMNDMTKELACIWNMGGVAIFDRMFGVIELTA